MEAVRGHLLLTNCLEDELTRPNIELALKADRLLWLDLEGTDDEVLTLLHEVFKIHPLAVEDVKEFHQRPKIEDYDDFVSIVAYGARGLGEPMTEVHCFYAERFLVSVHRDEVPAVAEACHTLGRLHNDRRLVALYRLLDALVDTMFPYLAAMDERIDELQDQIFVNPKESQLAASASAPRRWRLSFCSSCSGGAAGSARRAEPPAREGWREQSRLTLPLGSLVPTGRGVS